MDLRNIPRHIAIIMDGNGRWAKERHLSRFKGHQAGVAAIRNVVKAAGNLGVEYLTLYAFSIENWKRHQSEVAALMRLLSHFLKREYDELMAHNVRLITIGRTEDLPCKVRQELNRVIKATSVNHGLTLILALSYGGRSEILDAIKHLYADINNGKVTSGGLTEELFSTYLYTRGIPDPDLLIRTSGEMRISNFLLWQISYAEIWITPKYWPDFRKEDLIKAIEDYQNRNRRFGRV